MANINKAGIKGISESHRGIFKEVADILIPKYKNMPAASELGIEQEILNNVLKIRPDLKDGLIVALDYLAGDDDKRKALEELAQSNEAAFNDLTTVLTGGYYTNKEVWQQLGYPGQEFLPIDKPEETPIYIRNRMLEQVTKRGSIYRTT